MRKELTIADRDIAPALMDGLAGKIGKERFDLWFGDGTPWQIRGSILRIEVTDAFRMERARGFRREIQQVCEEIAGRELELEFAVASPPNELFSNDGKSGRAPSTKAGASDRSILPFSKAAGQQSASDAAGRSDSSPPSSPASGNVSPRKKYRDLKSLAVGESNRMAIVSAERILRRPGDASPFLLYGPSGSGKTHLLDAIRGEARKRGMRRVVMQTAEQFTSSYIEALQGAGLPSFRSKYRDVAFLILDDVQFFAGKKATLVELQHTLDSLIRKGRQIVLSADRAPAELASLPQELRARFAGGLVADIAPPDFAVRREILDKWETPLKLSAPVKRLLAERITGDARRLAGAIHRLEVASEAYQCEVTVEFAERSLRDLLLAHRQVIGLRDIEDAVCEAFGVDKDCIRSKRRDRQAAHPRMLAMWLARKHTRAGLAEIGRFFGKRSHSTVISADKKVQSMVGNGGSMQTAQGPCHVEDAIARIERRLQAG
jgi:chromosomal replication initiator protein